MKGYKQLNDAEGLIKYCQDIVNELSELDSIVKFEITDYDMAGGHQRIYIKMLNEIMYTCAQDACPSENMVGENIVIHKLAYAHLQLADALKQKQEYNKSIEHAFKSFKLSQQCDGRSTVNHKLIDFIEKLNNNHEYSNPSGLISEYMQVSGNDGIRLWLQIIAAYCNDEFQESDFAEQIDSVINLCFQTLSNTTKFEPELKIAFHFTILRMYMDLRVADATGKGFIEQMAKESDYKERQNYISLFDQRLLSKGVRYFIDEYNEGIEDEEKIPSTLADQFFLPSLQDVINVCNDTSHCIGDTLLSISDYQGAIFYWESILSEYTSVYSKPLLNLMYNEEATIDNIFDELQQLQDDANKYILRFVTSYEELARYNMEVSKRPDVPTSNLLHYVEKAKENCQAAMKLRLLASCGKELKTMDLDHLDKEIDKQKVAVKDKIEEGEETRNREMLSFDHFNEYNNSDDYSEDSTDSDDSDDSDSDADGGKDSTDDEQ